MRNLQTTETNNIFRFEFSSEIDGTKTFLLKNNNMDVSVNDNHIVITTSEQELIVYEIWDDEKCLSVKMHIINPNHLSSKGCTSSEVFTMHYGKKYAADSLYAAVMDALEGHLRPWTSIGYEKYPLN